VLLVVSAIAAALIARNLEAKEAAEAPMSSS